MSQNRLRGMSNAWWNDLFCKGIGFNENELTNDLVEIKME